MACKISAFVLVLTFAIPSFSSAQDSQLLASAERFVTEIAAQESNVNGLRRSTGRVFLGLAMAGAGAAMMLIDPKQPTQPTQPTQPGVVSSDTLIDETFAFIGSPEVGDLVFEVAPDCVYNVPACHGAALIGGAAGVVTATSGNRTVYGGPFRPFIPFIPFEERSSAMKYGGAALVMAGVAVAGFWSHVPVMRHVTMAPTLGGVHVGTRVGF